MMCDELFRHVMNYKGTNAKRKINDVAMIMQKYVGVTTTWAGRNMLKSA